MLGKRESTVDDRFTPGLRTTKLGNAPEMFMIAWNKTLLLVMVFLAMLGIGSGVVRAGVIFRDALEDPRAWSLQPSDGVEASLEQATDERGKRVLRLRYDFRAGSGFVVIRRPVGIPLPPEYRLSFQLRGSGPANNFEIKLLDPSGENVWWVNQRDHVMPGKWTLERFKRRHFSFAWGPSGGKPHETLGAIEFAIAASSGGSGTLELADLALESIPKPEVRSESISILQAGGTIDRSGLERLFARGGASIDWLPGAGDGSVTIDLGRSREFGGVIGRFEPGTGPHEVRIETSLDGKVTEEVGSTFVAQSGAFYLPLPDCEASFLRVRVIGASAETRLKALELAPLEFGASMNGVFTRIAADQPRGIFPRYLLGEQQYWTVVGVADDKNEALLSTDGAVEVDKEQFSLDPILLPDGGEPLTWANAKLSQELADGYLPLPSVTREHPGLRLRIDAFAFGPAGESALAIRYTVTNTGTTPASGKLLLAVRPLQVNPPWQDLKTSGGFTPIDAIGVDSTTDPILIVRRERPNAVKTVQVICGGGGGGGGGGVTVVSGISDFGDSAVRLIAREGRASLENQEEARRAMSAAVVCSYDFQPGESKEWAAVSPFHGNLQRVPGMGKAFAGPIDLSLRELKVREDDVKGWWRTELNRVTLSIPADRALENTFRTAQAHILINRDGPAIQPGSRTYERSWIRDGCLTSSALLATGHGERVREFIDWYAPFQYPSGKVPCVVDKRGPDPVPEHDSHGQLLYLLHKYYIFTHDAATLEKNYPHVLKAVEYIESIRATRMTPEYANATGIKRAEYGLVPESISHEGYSAKPMHSYWDDFFVEKGLQDAADIARILGKQQDAERFGKLAADFRASVLDSVNRTMAHHKIDYIPGCVELGDFDATSTTIALWPCGGQAWLPDAALRRTFEKFYEFGMGRIDGTRKYNEYTPYEWRIVGAMIRLGWPEKAWKLADFYMADRRPAAWNQWAEVVWREPTMPKFIGDMPHTWVASDFLNSVRSMFVYEDEASHALVLGAGIKPDWLAGEGVSIGSWPTEFGVLSYSAKRGGNRLTVNYEFSGALPAGKLILSPNLAGRQMVLSEPKGIVEIEMP